MKKGDDIIFKSIDGVRVGTIVEVGSTGIITVLSDRVTYTTYAENVQRVLSPEDRVRAHKALEVLRAHPEEPSVYGEAISTLIGLIRGTVPNLFLSTAAWSELPYLLTSERALRNALEVGDQLLQLKVVLDGAEGPAVESPGAGQANITAGPVRAVGGELTALRDYVPPTHGVLPPRPDNPVQAAILEGTIDHAALLKSGARVSPWKKRPRPRLTKPKAFCQECRTPVSPEFAVCSRCYERRQGRKPMVAVADGWIGARRA